MFENNRYITEELQEQKQEQLHRVARQQSWLESGVLWIWRFACVALRGMGHGLVGVGRLLLRLPGALPAEQPPMSAAALNYSQNCNE